MIGADSATRDFQPSWDLFATGRTLAGNGRRQQLLSLARGWSGVGLWAVSGPVAQATVASYTLASPKLIH